MLHDKKSPDTYARGRGADSNPMGRFERLDADVWRDSVESLQLKTELYKDSSKSIIATNDSPDIGFTASLNPYRGCEHGCIYCYARPTHEYLGLSAGLDFERKIFVKTDAAALLRKSLALPSWKPQVVAMSGVTDCYQPVERKLKLTRACLEVFAEFRNPVAIITKNVLVTRDIDLLQRLAEFRCVRVNVSVTSLDGELARKLEPRTSQPEQRLRAIRELTAAGIPVNVMVAPVIPGLTDEEIPAILEAAADAGAESAAFTMLRLPYGVKDLFAEWLETHAPLRKEKVLNRVKDMRGGKLNDSSFGDRMRGHGLFADTVQQLFDLHSKRLFAGRKRYSLETRHFRRDGGVQGTLF